MSQDPTDLQRLQSLNTVGTISYILHLIVAIGALVPGGQFGPVLLIVALVLDLVNRDKAEGTWHAPHFRWRIRSVLIANRAAALDRAIKEMGITFRVYSKTEGSIDRPWPLDLIPRIITRKEWEQVEKGLVQRVHQLAIDVELELLVRGVADTHGLGAFVARKPVDLPFGEPAFAQNAVHDLHVRRTASDGALKMVLTP